MIYVLKVKHERPDLEEQREVLIRESSENKTLLKTLEDTLLRVCLLFRYIKSNIWKVIHIIDEKSEDFN